MLSTLLGLSMQSIIVPLRSGSFSRAAVEQRPQFILADPGTFYAGLRPTGAYTVSKIGAFSRAAVEQRPQLILADPSDLYTGFSPNEGFPVSGIGGFSRDSVEKQPQLVLTSPANWFSSISLAEGFTLPTLPPVIDFLTSNWYIRPNTAVPTATVEPITTETVVSSTTLAPSEEEKEVQLSTEAPLVSSDVQEVPKTTAPIVNVAPVMPAIRLPVTTRPPGVPHHYKDEKDDNFISYEISDGVHKITSNRQSFEIRYTNPNTGTLLKSADVTEDIPIKSKSEVKEDETRSEKYEETPVATPVQEAAIHVTPPLIRNSNDAAIQSVGTIPLNAINVLTQPEFPPQPFFNANALISRIQALPFEDRYARTFVTVA